MSFSYFSFLMNKPRKHLGRVDQRLLIQLSSSKLVWVLLVRHFQASLIPHGDYSIENSCSSWFPALTFLPWLVTLTPHRDVGVHSFSIPPLPGGSLGEDRMQTDGSILLSAVSFGLGAAFHIVQMFNATEWCCFGSFVILGGAQCLQIFLSWKTICKKNPKKQKVENSE